MAKRKSAEEPTALATTPQKRQRKGDFRDTSRPTKDVSSSYQNHRHINGSTPTSSLAKSKSREAVALNRDADQEEVFEEAQEDSGSPTPRTNGKALFETAQKTRARSDQTPSKSVTKKSAGRKVSRDLVQPEKGFHGDGENGSSAFPLDEIQGVVVDEEEPVPVADDVAMTDPSTPTATPSKRGRPKGSKNRRSPTPEGDIPPEERYFFQNRSGPTQISRNIFSSVHSLTHEEYFQEMRSYKDSHEVEKAYLMKLHFRSFHQWKLELAHGFGVCLHGYGSKRNLVQKFAQWLYKSSTEAPLIVIINGFTAKLNLRTILSTIGSTLVGEGEELRLTGQPQEMLDMLLAYLSGHPPRGQLLVMINSLDGSGLRRSGTQALLARLAAHPLVHLLATADTPTFSAMWNSSLLDQFNFAFHDCSTFAPYDAEINAVDDVHELLGRKGRRMGGKEGVGFVLKSLPENARNLYRVLLNDILSILTDGVDNLADEGLDDDQSAPNKAPKDMTEEVGVEYRSLYQKASEEFICSSDMNFRFLLKEFHDHQMITSRRDASGTELLSVPLGKEDIELILEDLAAG